MTSPTCLLQGHQFAMTEGVGRFAGRQFSVCAVCGAFELLADFNEHQEAAGVEMTRRWNLEKK